MKAWADRYGRLGHLMYAVRRRCPDLGALATSSLHPRNPVPAAHHALLAAFAAGGVVRIPSTLAVARGTLLTALAAIRDTCIAATVRLVAGRAGAGARRADVVLKTWAFGPGSLQPGHDFYYGDLPALLAARGVASVLICGDARPTPALAFARAVLARSDGRAVPEWALVPLWAPVACLVRQVRGAARLRAVARAAADADVARVAARAADEALSPGALRTQLAYHVAATAVRRWRPRAFVTLYEGQPWEKLAWHGAKAADLHCLVVGYQHTVVTRHTLALTAPNTGSWELATPDVALCLGDATRRLLEHGHRGTATRLETFGTFRWSGLRSGPTPPAPERRTVLVVPEGNVPECRLLFGAALAVARRLPDHHFLFRCHPVLPFDEVRPQLHAAPEGLPNVELSERTRIEDDFARSSVVLYRGSSSVLYAATAGLKLVYLQRDGEPDNDPLFELTGWRDRVASDDELVETLRAYAATPAEQAEKAWRDALDYIGAYTTPVAGESIDRFLDAVGLRAAAR